MTIDVTLANIATFQNDTSAVTATNTNSASIAEAFTDAVSISGVIPNQMESNIDMNSNRIINLPAPISADEPVRSVDLQNAVLGTLPNISSATIQATGGVPSTSTTTGSLIVSGGVGISGELWTPAGDLAATSPAYTFKGNNTATSGYDTNVSIASLTSKASPVTSDLILIADSAASNAWKSATVGSVASAGSVSSVNGQTGALQVGNVNSGRITLTSGTPVMSSSVAGATTVYFTPCGGNTVPIFDGTNLVPTVFAEISQALSDTTKSPAAAASSSVYDVFVWNDSGTVRATRGPAWQSVTARGTGGGTSQLVVVNGVYMNAVAITNGPVAQRGTYVGSIKTNSSATVDYIFGAQGTAAVLGVWNNYNRVLVTTTVSDNTASWTYSTATWRQANGSAVNQVSFLSGLAEEGINTSYWISANTGTAQGSSWRIGPALDSTVAPVKIGVASNSGSAFVMGSTINVASSFAAQLGFHNVTACEQGDGTNTTTFVGQTSQGLVFSTYM